MAQNEGGCGPWLLFMDLDGTMWDHLDISSVDPPYRLVEPGVIVGGDGVRIKLYPQAVEFVEWARRNGAITCTLSWNHPGHALGALRAFGIAGLFDHHEIEYSPHKYMGIRRLLGVLGERGVVVSPERIVYVDDRDIHIDEIYREVGRVLFIHIWKQVRDYEEAKRLVEQRVLGRC